MNFENITRKNLEELLKNFMFQAGRVTEAFEKLEKQQPTHEKYIMNALNGPITYGLKNQIKQVEEYVAREVKTVDFENLDYPKEVVQFFKFCTLPFEHGEYPVCPEDSLASLIEEHGENFKAIFDEIMLYNDALHHSGGVTRAAVIGQAERLWQSGFCLGL